VALFHRRRLEREIDEEVAFHLAMREADRQREGFEDPGRSARRQFGNVTVVKEQVRDMWSFPSLESIWQDVRYALRVLRKAPGFTIVAVLALGVGIGANTAIYSLVDAVLVRGLPYQDPDRLMVLIGNVERTGGVERRGGSYPDFLDWRAQATHFDGMAAYSQSTVTLGGEPEPERIFIETVSAPYFSLLGIEMAAGRAFRADEDEVPDRNAVIILAEGLVQRRFGDDRSIVGRQVLVGTRMYDVIGIAPAGFRGLSDGADAWIPFVMSGPGLQSRGNRGFQVVARLKPGSTIEQARAEMDGISKRLAEAYPATNDKRAVEVTPLATLMLGYLEPVLFTLMGAVAFVLLIACTNVANLLVSRSEARQREIAVRTALGAGQARLGRQLFTESLVLAGMGAIAGLATTELAVRALVAASPVTLPSFVQPGINGSVLAFTMFCALGCGVLLGLAPLMHARIARLAEALKDSARGSSSARSQRMRGALVVVEVSLAVVLLAGAGLMIRSAQRLTAIDPGFDPDPLLTLSVSIPRTVAPPAAPQPPGTPPPPPPPLVVSAQALLERVRAIPGVASVSLGTDVPLAGGSSAIFYAAEGDTIAAGAQTMPRAYVHRVTPAFFDTLGMPIRAGRAFTEADLTPDSTAVIVSKGVVDRFWPGQDPIGKRIKTGPNAPWLSIVGVVSDVKYRGLPENPTADPDLYFPFVDRPVQSVLIRATVDPESLANPVRAAIRELHGGIVIYNLNPVSTLVAAQTAPSRFTTWLLGTFAAAALALAVIGLYGVMSYLVAQRQREFGIRLALGASRREIVTLVLRHAGRLIALGLVVGSGAAVLLSRYLEAQLYQVTTTDPSGFMAVGVLAVVAMAACCIPAIRATRVDPVVALRTD